MNVIWHVSTSRIYKGEVKIMKKVSSGLGILDNPRISMYYVGNLYLGLYKRLISPIRNRTYNTARYGICNALRRVL